MTKGILGRRIGMTQVFGENGKLIPATVVGAEGNVVLQKRTIEVDGHNAIQVGFGNKKTYRKDAESNKYASKPAESRAKKANVAPKRFIREFRDMDVGAYEVGQEVSVDTFVAGNVIDIAGVSKDKSFQGVIKRHGQSCGPMSYGSHFHRASGSVGMASDISRVFKDRKTPRRMGGNTVTVRNLEVAQVDTENKVVSVRSDVSGPRRGLVKIRTPIKKGNK